MDDNKITSLVSTTFDGMVALKTIDMVRDLGVCRACLCAVWVKYMDLVSIGVVRCLS